jgi:hypothetical protein
MKKIARIAIVAFALASTLAGTCFAVGPEPIPPHVTLAR